MSTLETTITKTKEPKGQSLWADAWITLKRDKWAMIALLIVVTYAAVAILSACGLLAADWAEEVGKYYESPGTNFFFGTDYLGRSVFKKVIYGTQIAMTVGLFTTLITIPIGITLGCLAGYFGGWVDDIIVWFYTTLESIPSIMTLMALSMILERGLMSVCIALGVINWVSLCRLIRGEVMKHKHREYVQAAGAIGGGHFRKLFKHILPNVFHIVIINASLQFQTAIKSEVILSYLGIGVQNKPSWGIMISDAGGGGELQNGVWWQLAAATLAMFFIVLAFNILGDALRDALDPKLKGKD